MYGSSAGYCSSTLTLIALCSDERTGADVLIFSSLEYFRNMVVRDRHKARTACDAQGLPVRRVLADVCYRVEVYVRLYRNHVHMYQAGEFHDVVTCVRRAFVPRGIHGGIEIPGRR